jgi:hypothetical protein
MLLLLVALLALDAVLHVLIIARFGIKGNVPFLIYVFIFAAMAVAVYVSVPYALLATLVLTLLGIIGQTVNLNRITRDKTLDRVIWTNDAAILLCTAYLLFLH